MENEKILSFDFHPDLYSEIKRFTQAYEDHKRVLEQDSGFTQDEARTQVLKLSHALVEGLYLLRIRMELGTLDR